MTDLCMLSHLQVLQDSTRSDNTVLQMLDSEAFQVLRFEMLQQLLTRTGFGKHPVIQFESKELASEVTFKHSPLPPFKKYLLRGKIIQELINIVERSFRCQEFTGRDIEERNAASRFSKMHGSEEVIFLIIQNIIIDRDTRSNQFCDSALHEFLRHFGIFQLVADRHPLTCADQFRQISIQRMMRKPRHFDGFTFTIGTLGQCDS